MGKIKYIVLVALISILAVACNNNKIDNEPDNLNNRVEVGANAEEIKDDALETKNILLLDRTVDMGYEYLISLQGNIKDIDTYENSLLILSDNIVYKLESGILEVFSELDNNSENLSYLNSLEIGNSVLVTTQDNTLDVSRQNNEKWIDNFKNYTDNKCIIEIAHESYSVLTADGDKYTVEYYDNDNETLSIDIENFELYSGDMLESKIKEVLILRQNSSLDGVVYCITESNELYAVNGYSRVGKSLILSTDTPIATYVNKVYGNAENNLTSPIYSKNDKLYTKLGDTEISINIHKEDEISRLFSCGESIVIELNDKDIYTTGKLTEDKTTYDLIKLEELSELNKLYTIQEMHGCYNNYIYILINNKVYYMELDL